jgi:FtsP/CotA-like multicopper oxidase with cupredoxin domain
VAVLAGGFVLYTSADTSTVGKLEFTNELKIPPLLEAAEDDDGRKTFRLDLQRGTSEFLPDKKTETWGANGTYLAPTLRAARGDRVQMHVRNGLPAPTTIHWHGMHLPAQADGNPHQTIARGETWSPGWTIDQPAATLWYHPHPHGETGDHTYRGVTGMFILDDSEARALALPKSYGVDDVPVIIQDKKFEGDGSLDFSPGTISPTGLLGDDILVNGTYGPYLDVTTERVRLRLLNASGARVYNVGLSDNRSFHLVATDSGLLDRPVRMKRLELSPAERAEILVGVEPGERPVLRSYKPDLGTDFWTDRFAGGDDSFDLLQLRAAERLRSSAPVPEQLVRVSRLDENAPIAETRRFELSGQSSINGKEMDLGRIDVRAKVDTTELWEVRNQGNTPHNFHVHDVQFQVVEYADNPPPPRLAGWKDTVNVPPDESVRFLVRFSDYTDLSTPYMLHCHIHQHQDRGMMGQFVVERQPRRDTNQP